MPFNVLTEVVFSTNGRAYPPSSNAGGDGAGRKEGRKHLGMILDEELNFQNRIREAILKVRRGVGPLRHLFKHCMCRDMSYVRSRFEQQIIPQH